MFPKPKLTPEERMRRFAEKMNYYQQYGSTRNSGQSQSQNYHSDQFSENHQYHTDEKSENNDNFAKKPRGRIIDVEPEN